MPFGNAWLAVGGALVFLGFAASVPALMAVGFIVLLLGGLTRYWNRHLFDRLSFVPKLRERRTFIGEPVTLDVSLTNAKFLPLPWYEWRLGIADRTTVNGEHLSNAAAPGLSWLTRNGAMGWYEHREWVFELEANVRGYHQVGPHSIRSSDLLGVFQGAKEGDIRQGYTVFPRVYSLPELGLPAANPFGDRRGRNRLFEDPSRVAGLREYRPGDSLRRIDWKATARRGEIQSRIYEPSATQQLYIMLNIDTMQHAWEGYLKEELERAISAAASIAVWAADQGYAIGLLANGSFPEADRPIRLAPSQSPDQLTRVLEALAVIQPLTLGDLATSIARESGRMPAGCTVVGVAALMPESLVAALSRLQDEGHVVSVVATSEQALEGVPAHLSVVSLGRAFGREGVIA